MFPSFADTVLLNWGLWSVCRVFAGKIGCVGGLDAEVTVIVTLKVTIILLNGVAVLCLDAGGSMRSSVRGFDLGVTSGVTSGVRARGCRRFLGGPSRARAC